MEGFKFWETVELILETKFVQVVASSDSLEAVLRSRIWDPNPKDPWLNCLTELDPDPQILNYESGSGSGSGSLLFFKDLKKFI